LSNEQWRRDGTNSNGSPALTQSYTALRTFLETYAIPVIHSIPARNITIPFLRANAHFLVGWQIRANPRTDIPVTVWTAQLIDDFLFAIFDNRPGNDGWAVTHGPPELMAWAKQTSPKVACGHLIRNPYSEIPDVNAGENGEEADEDGPGKLSHGFPWIN
jgi:hypothetical protein